MNMLTANEVTTDICVDSLYSVVCPACGDRKQSERSLCYECFCSLPGPMKAALYKGVGQGYEPAMLKALNHLKAEKVHT